MPNNGHKCKSVMSFINVMSVVSVMGFIIVSVVSDMRIVIFVSVFSSTVY